jgi:hypothetical protein
MQTWTSKEHDKAMVKVVFNISVEQTKGNEESYFYLYPSRVLVLKNFQRGFYV